MLLTVVSISWCLESDSNPVFHPYGPCQSNYLGPRSTSFKSVASVCLRELASAGRHVSETARGTVKRPAEHRTHPPARELEAWTLLGGGGLTSHGDSGHVHSPACGLEMKILKCSELILILRVILCSVCVYDTTSTHWILGVTEKREATKEIGLDWQICLFLSPKLSFGMWSA